MDLIDRQAAIDAMRQLEEDDIEMFGCPIPEEFDSDRAIEALKELPSIQPELATNLQPTCNQLATDCISRQAAIDELCDNCDNVKAVCAHYPCKQYIAIERLPSVQPRKGKWVKENIVLTTCPPQYQWHCSECGAIRHWFSAEVLTNFCPNCGADMRPDDN